MIKSLYRFWLKKLSPLTRVKIQYFRNFKTLPNLNHPISINEKILKRIFFEKDPQFAFYADKYAVRTYISETIGQAYLVPLIAAFDDAEALGHLEHWEQVVIKPNHGAGMVKIIQNAPQDSEKIEIIDLAKQWLATDYSQICDEWHYSLIKPKLLVEKKITEENEALKDFKFHRFLQADGQYKQILQVVAERSELGYETVFFDVANLDDILHSPFGYSIVLTLAEKNSIKQILDLNEQLCSEYSYVRLDWYITKKQIYFGEITFTPGSGRSKSFAGQFGEEIGTLWNM